MIIDWVVGETYQIEGVGIKEPAQMIGFVKSKDDSGSDPVVYLVFKYYARGLPDKERFCLVQPSLFPRVRRNRNGKSVYSELRLTIQVFGLTVDELIDKLKTEWFFSETF